MNPAEHLDLLTTAPDGIKRLRGLILELAVRGKLVPQDPADEPWVDDGVGADFDRMTTKRLLERFDNDDFWRRV